MTLPTEFKRRSFDWSGLIAKRKGQIAFPLGYGSMYNHANPANLTYSGLRSTNVLMFVANQVIKAGAELTINYDERSGVNRSSESPWATRNDIELI
jgi:SET domain-containing protein